MKKLRVGVIGCGVMGRFHAKQYKNIAEVELVGVSDADPNKKIDDIPFFNDYRELLKIVDAVSIATPTFTHFDVGSAALDAGKHILIEKPIALNIEQGTKLIEKAHAKKLVIAVGHIERFNPAFMRLEKMIESTKPDIIDIKRMSPLPARIADVSVIIDMMIHDIDLAIKLAKSEVKNINAVGRKVKTDRLDQSQLILVFRNGVVANIEASRVHTDKVRGILIAAGKNVFDADLLNRTLKRSSADSAEVITVESFDQLNTELRNFIYAIQNKKKPAVTGEDGLAALDIAEKAEKAALASC